jgi:hypothetical protein
MSAASLSRSVNPTAKRASLDALCGTSRVYITKNGTEA